MLLLCRYALCGTDLGNALCGTSRGDAAPRRRCYADTPLALYCGVQRCTEVRCGTCRRSRRRRCGRRCSRAPLIRHRARAVLQYRGAHRGIALPQYRASPERFAVPA
eukprot:3576359-Rhodomonas_salina.3